MGRLYLVRHAQSANNAVWNGRDFHPGRHSDPEVTELGHRQSERLAGHLAHPEAEPRQHPLLSEGSSRFGLTHVYCSLMTRSIVTAEYIAEACRLELHALPDVFEKYGIYEFDDHGRRVGLPGPGRAYFDSRFPRLNLPADFNEDGWWSRDAEDETAFLVRMRRVVERFRDRLAGSDDAIALVAHGDFIDQFVNDLMGVDRHRHNYAGPWVANWAFHNTSISRIDFVGGSHHVVYLNRLDHLPNELVSW